MGYTYDYYPDNTELTKEQAKQMLIDHNNGDKLPPNMLEIIKGMVGDGE